METPTRQQRIAALRDTIADIERKPALRETHAMVSGKPTSFPKLAGGLLQEVFTDERRNAGAILGFALAQSRSLLTPQRLAVMHLQLAGEASRLGVPYGPGLISFGFDPDALVLVRVKDMTELLWAAEEAIACRAIAAVVADIGSHSKILDFTASRRLSLRAAQSGASMFLLRYGLEREASAAHLRWRLSPARSLRKRHDDRAPGQQRWLAQLERGVVIKQQAEWLVGWSKDGFATFPAQHRNQHGIRIPAAVPGLVPAHLADRLSQTA